MYRPTLKKKTRHHVICQGRITLGPSFWGPRFFKPMESGPCFLYHRSNTVIIIALQNFTQGAYM